MFNVVLFLILGTILGFLLRDQKNVTKLSNRLIDCSIYLFLFFLGLSIGGNKIIIDHIVTFGIQAFTLAIGGIVGSIFTSYFVYKYFFKNIENEK